MFGANITMRSLKNADTGIDITVPSIQEVEAPLGGTSTEYEISVLTSLDLYKSHLHSKDDVIHFSIYKAYKEVEDFYDKVVKKFSDVNVPSIPKGRSISKCSVEDKRSSLDKFMQEVSRHKDICDSSLFLQFLGINKHRKSRSSISETFSEVSLHDSGVSSPGSSDQNSQLSSQIEDNSSQYNNISKTFDESNEKDETDNDDPTISELFPKMKVRKSSKVDVVDEKPDIHDELPPALPSLEVKESEESLNDDLDLFEEVQKIEKGVKKEKAIDSGRSSHHGLFDDFEDESSLLFSSPHVQSNLSKPSHTFSETVSNTSKSSLSMAVQEDISDGEAPDLFAFHSETHTRQTIVSKETNSNDLFKTNRLFGNEDEVDTRKQNPGEISLFEEQDLGTCIKKEDEELFFVAKSDKSFVVNTLLSPTTDNVPDDDGVTESLEELITLPEPSAELPKTESTPVVKEVRKLPPKPVPKPRVKSLSSVAPEKPQVLPRKVFLSKPTLPPKPLPPPKPKPSVAAGKQPKGSAAITENQKNTLDNLSSLDIMQYIEQEEKIANSQAGLFD